MAEKICDKLDCEFNINGSCSQDHCEQEYSQEINTKIEDSESNKIIDNFINDYNDLSNAKIDQNFNFTNFWNIDFSNKLPSSLNSLYSKDDVMYVFDKSKTILKSNQIEALSHLLRGKNCFLKGDAGTGKTFLIEMFSKLISERGYKILKCATTQLAVSNFKIHNENEIVGTLSSVFSIEKKVYWKDTPIDPKLVQFQLSNYDVIILDEISLCRVDWFNFIIKNIYCADEYRKTKGKKPIQFIVTGDFYQLPCSLPISFSAKMKAVFGKHYKNDFNGYAFEDKEAWDFCDFSIITLWDNIRQEKDPTYASILRLIRNKNCEVIIKDIVKGLNEQFIDNGSIDFINPITLYSYSIDAEKHNKEMIDSIPEYKLITSTAKYNGDIKKILDNDKVSKLFLNKLPAAKVIKFAKNTPFVFTCDYNSSELNISFSAGQKGIIEDGNENEITVKTNDSIFKLKKESFTQKIIKSPKILVNGNQGSVTQGYYNGTYTQFPIKIAYGLSIQDAQGQTYNYLKINPLNIRNNGQLYVAMSRVKQLENLRFTQPLQDTSIKFSLNVEEFYAKINELIPSTENELNDITLGTQFARQFVSLDEIRALAKKYGVKRSIENPLTASEIAAIHREMLICDIQLSDAMRERSEMIKSDPDIDPGSGCLTDIDNKIQTLVNRKSYYEQMLNRKREDKDK